MIFHLVSHHIYSQEYIPSFYNFNTHIPIFQFSFQFIRLLHSLIFLLSHKMNKNGRREENSCCYFHPEQAVVGVCPLCLNERLLILAAKQSDSSTSRGSHRLQGGIQQKPSVSLHKIFALGSLFGRPESRQWKSQNYEHDESTSPEGKFIA